SSGRRRSRCPVMSRRLELGLALALALAVSVAVVAGRRGSQRPEFDLRPSSLLSGPLGSRAPYDVLAWLHVPVTRRRTPLFDFVRDSEGGRAERGGGGGRGGAGGGGGGAAPAVLLVLDPPRQLYAAELAQVVRFVRAGGGVVAAGRGGGITHCVGWRTENEARFLPRDSFPVTAPAPALVLPAVGDFLQPL